MKIKMPSKSAKQAKMMRAVAHSPEFAKEVGIPQSVGQEFATADANMGAGAPSIGLGKVAGPMSPMSPDMMAQAPMDNPNHSVSHSKGKPNLNKHKHW